MRDEAGSVAELPEMVAIWEQTLGWCPDFRQQVQFQQFYQLVLQGNQQFNLTRITAPQEFWEKHLWDSLSGIKPWLEEKQQEGQRAEGEEKAEGRGQKAEGDTDSFTHPPIHPSTPPLLHSSTPYRAIDIGTGAGFPGVPVAIAHPDWTVTLLDSTRKKMAFVDQVLAELGIQNARTVVDRAEQAGHDPQHRAAYDLALIRAVAAAAVCAEYALPLLKIGGMAVLYRGQWREEEAIGLRAALEKLGGELEQVEKFLTPLSQGVRHCLYLRKVQSTPDLFPRSIGIPTQKPL